MARFKQTTFTHRRILAVLHPRAVQSRASHWDGFASKDCRVCGLYVPREPVHHGLAPWRHWIVPKDAGGFPSFSNVVLAHSACAAVYSDCGGSMTPEAFAVLSTHIIRVLRTEPVGSPAWASGQRAYARITGLPFDGARVKCAWCNGVHELKASRVSPGAFVVECGEGMREAARGPTFDRMFKLA